MSKAIAKRAHWRPARYSMGALPLGLSKLPAEGYAGGLGGLTLGLIVGKPVGDALKISAPAATAVLAVVSVGIPMVLGKKNISRSLADVFYGAGVGFGGATIFRLVQSFFSVPPPSPAPAPAP